LVITEHLESKRLALVLGFHMSPELGSTGQTGGAVGARDAQIHVSPFNVLGHVLPQFLAVVADRTDIEVLPCTILVHPYLVIHTFLQFYRNKL
jgi:hypothetical protein